MKNCGVGWSIVDEPSWYGVMVMGMVWYGQVQFGMVWCVVWCVVWYGMVWYGVWSGTILHGMVCTHVWTTLANGKEGRRRPTHEDVHLSFLKVGQKAEERPPLTMDP